MIDKIVTSKEFRENLVDQEFNFVKAVADPIVISAKWEKLFSNAIKIKQKCKRSKFQLKIRLYYFLFANKLYFRKIKNRFF